MTLHHRLIGDSGPLVVFCHGLFGQGKNWTTIAKALTPQYRCLLVDMLNHGRSPRDEVVDYDRMADAVVALLESEFGDSLPCTLVGHSMGGKIVMRIALRRPDLVARLVVVDMIPGKTGHVNDNGPLIEAMLGLNLDTLTSRQEADARLTPGIPDPTVRAFVMQNLHHSPAGWSWSMNLPALSQQRDRLLDWPPIDGRYDGPVLWVKGERSPYIRTKDTQPMRALFPNVYKLIVKDAGHWVHSEQPAVMIKSLQQFLARTDAQHV